MGTAIFPGGVVIVMQVIIVIVIVAVTVVVEMRFVLIRSNSVMDQTISKNQEQYPVGQQVGLESPRGLQRVFKGCSGDLAKDSLFKKYLLRNAESFKYKKISFSWSKLQACLVACRFQKCPNSPNPSS